jgi:predicted PurR-regulated permease PerM
MVVKGKKIKKDGGPKESEGLYNSDRFSGLVFRKTVVQSVVILIIISLALLIGSMFQIFLLFFAGIMLAVLLNLFGRQLSRLPWIPYWLAITIVIIILTLLIVLFIIIVGPIMVEEMGELASQLEESIMQLIKRMEENAVGQFLLKQISELEETVNNGQIWARVSGIFSGTFTAITGVLIMLIVGIFLAYSPGMYQSGFLHLVPIDLRDRADEIITEIGSTLRWWLVGQLISMLVLAVSTWIMLVLLNVPLAPILALITGLLTFVPYLGPFIAFVPIVLVAFLQSPILALYVFIIYMIIQNLEGNVLMPLIFYRTVHIPPAIGVVSQILFGSLMGLMGFVLAIPLMAVFIKFVKMVYVEDVLGDKSVEQ